MTAPAVLWPAGLDARARPSLGCSDDAIYRLVGEMLARHGALGGHLVDAGCGRGGLFQTIGDAFDTYSGLDAVLYEGFPIDRPFYRVNLDADQWSVPVQGDVVAAVETIEHLENPWSCFRSLARMAKPGGWVVVTTPNQQSVLSLLTLLWKGRFSAFQDSHFPTHRTALLECDLRRAAADCGLLVADVAYSRRGRLPLMSWHYPSCLARVAPRCLSDNIAILARRPTGL